MLFGLPWLRRGRWPRGTPPTVGGDKPQFHCYACKHPVGDRDKKCAHCGAPIPS